MIEAHHAVIWLSGLAEGAFLGVAVGAVLFRGLVDPYLLRPLATARCLWRSRRRDGRR